VNIRRLFVGGPWHGQIHEVPENNRAYEVVLPSRNWDLMGDRVLYTTYRFGGGYALIAVMCAPEIRFYGNEEDQRTAAGRVMEAIGQALQVQVLAPGGTVSDQASE